MRWKEEGEKNFTWNGKNEDAKRCCWQQSGKMTGGRIAFPEIGNGTFTFFGL
jgi:hypothetical protein